MRQRMLKGIILSGILVLMLLGPLSAQLAAQTSELPRRTEAYSWSSGEHDGIAQQRLAFRDVVTVPGSPWMQLTFSRGNLGTGSYVEITSLKDGASQRLDGATLRQWNFRSAYFNGDAVEIQLHVGSKDRAVALEIEEVVVGEWAAFVPNRSICGVDNRVASNEPKVARIDPIGCTGWNVSNGKYLTAGHCLAGGSSNQTLSYNPPQSLPDGTVQFPGPDDQYAINQGSFQFVNGGVGNDWGIFTVANNTQTGLQPIQAQGAFDLRQDFGPSTIRITGFGVDDGTTNQTNQTHAGPNTGSSGTTMRYATDTTGGNSGSPVIDDATGVAVGIHTHGGCASGNNSGTSFFNSALWTAVDFNSPPPPPPPPGLDCPAGSIDFNNLALTSYSNQNATNGTSVQDAGDILVLTGNTWVRSTQSFTITANTVIEFQFASGSQGEIHAIGFDNDDTLNNDPRHFQFWGTQNWTGTGKIDLTPKYNGSGNFQSYSIPVGESYTGTMNLVFTNDKDSGTLNNESQFGCVRVFEDGAPPPPPPPPPGGCTVDDDFEAGAAGWANDGASTCSTGAFVLAAPTQQTSTVVTQVGGDHTSGAGNALFTATNSSAGNADVDGGNCILTSPVWNVANASTFSVWYFHGQRDSGDDANGDFFDLEISTNGGATFSSIVSIGDVRTVANWTNVTANVAAGSNVQVRVQVSDGAGPGDIVEGGIDDLSICDN